jgi:lipopolysaccharide/colanic/teichoic acid biosynthesis glycosyltransferase
MQLPDRGQQALRVPIAPPFNPVFVLPIQPKSSQVLVCPLPPSSAWVDSRSRRVFDFSIALAILMLLGVPMLLIAASVRMSSTGPAFFVQRRVGRRGRLFGIYKFRSMEEGSSAGPGLTRGGDSRVTSIGRWIRKFKLDELPQFYNVLRGEMSIVGPRPKLPLYEPITNMPYRPGITGAATLAFRNEEEMLRAVHASQLDHFYAAEIKPVKAQIDLDYMGRATLPSDLRMIAATFMACFAPIAVSLPSLRKTGSAEMLP